jgi:hypothetical protein
LVPVIACFHKNRSYTTLHLSTMAAGDNNNNAVSKTQSRQIPIVLPGHTRPLAELQFLYVPTEQRTFLISACHGKSKRCLHCYATIV